MFVALLFLVFFTLLGLFLQKGKNPLEVIANIFSNSKYVFAFNTLHDGVQYGIFSYIEQPNHKAGRYYYRFRLTNSHPDDGIIHNYPVTLDELKELNTVEKFKELNREKFLTDLNMHFDEMSLKEKEALEKNMEETFYKFFLDIDSILQLNLTLTF